MDAVLTFEGDTRHEWRILRATKNRFGSVNEIGVFEMHEDGMRQVENPSETLLSKRARGASGSAVACGMEGTRPLLVDVQALVSRSFLASPRRAVDGLEPGAQRYYWPCWKSAQDCGCLTKTYTSTSQAGYRCANPPLTFRFAPPSPLPSPTRPYPGDAVIFGEVGLAGEVRAVRHAARRVAEAARLGFTRCVLPRENLHGLAQPPGMTLLGVQTVSQAIALLLAKEHKTYIIFLNRLGGIFH